MTSLNVGIVFCLILFSCLSPKFSTATPMNSESLSVSTETETVSTSPNMYNSALADNITDQELSSSTEVSTNSTEQENSNSATMKPEKGYVNVSRSLSNIDKKIQRAIKDVLAVFNSTDRAVSKAVERSLLQTSRVIANNSASVISNTVQFLSQLKNNLVQQMANVPTGALKQLERSAVRTQSFFLENLNSPQRFIERINNGSTEAMKNFSNDVANLTRVVNNGLMNLLSRNNSSTNETMMRKSVGDIFTSFRNRQTNFLDSLLSLKTQARETFQNTLHSITFGWQDFISRGLTQFQGFTNGLLNFFTVSLNTLRLPSQKNTNNTNTSK